MISSEKPWDEASFFADNQLCHMQVGPGVTCYILFS